MTLSIEQAFLRAKKRIQAFDKLFTIKNGHHGRLVQGYFVFPVFFIPNSPQSIETRLIVRVQKESGEVIKPNPNDLNRIKTHYFLNDVYKDSKNDVFSLDMKDKVDPAHVHSYIHDAIEAFLNKRQNGKYLTIPKNADTYINVNAFKHDAYIKLRELINKLKVLEFHEQIYLLQNDKSAIVKMAKVAEWYAWKQGKRRRRRGEVFIPMSYVVLATSFFLAIIGKLYSQKYLSSTPFPYPREFTLNDIDFLNVDDAVLGTRNNNVERLIIRIIKIAEHMLKFSEGA